MTSPLEPPVENAELTEAPPTPTPERVDATSGIAEESAPAGDPEESPRAAILPAEAAAAPAGPPSEPEPAPLRRSLVIAWMVGLGALAAAVIAWRWLPYPFADAGCITMLPSDAPVRRVTEIADFFIFFPYMGIPLVLILLYVALARRGDKIPRELVILFGAFIVGCGFTHLFQLIAMYTRWYWAVAYVKVVTAAVSMTTLVVLAGPLYRKILTKVATGSVLRRAIRDKDAALARAEHALGQEEAMRVKLEGVVAEKSEALAAKDDALARAAGAMDIISRQLDTIREMETPIVAAGERTLLLSLIGIVDSSRAARVMEVLLKRIQIERTLYVVVDVSGVRDVDTEVAGHIARMVSAIDFMGARRSIMTGISAEIAQTMTVMGVRIAGATFACTVDEALQECREDLRARRGEGRALINSQRKP